MCLPCRPTRICGIMRIRKKVVLMSPTNLIAALRLALDLWKREYQEKNLQEIVKRGPHCMRNWWAYGHVRENG